MAESDRDPYFVRIEDRSRPARPTVEVPEEPHRPHRRRFKLRPLPVVLLVLAAFYAWGSTTEGGVSGRVNAAIEWMRDLLGDATSDPDLKRAATFFNDQYANTGSYQSVDEEEKATSVGVGVDVVYCNAHALVIQGLTASGTKSRLLVAGEDYGDVTGAVGCPANLADPEPWSVP